MKGPHGSHGNGTERGRLARLDAATLAIRESREVDENPGDVILTHDNAHVLVTHYDMKRAMRAAAQGKASPSTMFAQLQMWDGKTLTIQAERPICVAPHGIITTPDDGLAIVACYGSDERVVVDISTRALATSRYPMGASPGVPGVPKYGPYSVALLPGTPRVLVADLESSDVRTFDLETRRLLPEATIHLGSKVFMMAVVDATSAILPLQSPDGIARVDLVNHKITTRVASAPEECQRPHAVAIAKDRRTYVVCEGDHKAPGTVLEIDPLTLATRKKWTVGVYPDAIAFGD